MKIEFNYRLRMACCVHVLGWIVLTLLGAKTVYNLAHFVYTIYLAALLGRNIDPRNYGPWVSEILSN